MSVSLKGGHIVLITIRIVVKSIDIITQLKSIMQHTAIEFSTGQEFTVNPSNENKLKMLYGCSIILIAAAFRTFWLYGTDYD